MAQDSSGLVRLPAPGDPASAEASAGVALRERLASAEAEAARLRLRVAELEEELAGKHETSLVGRRVAIVGTSRQDLNGCTGRAVSFDRSNGRYRVQLSAGEPLAVRPENLEQTEDASTPDEICKAEVLRHLHADCYVQLGPSEIAGVGVFAFLPIPAGVDPFQICNPQLAPKERFVVCSAAELRELPVQVLDQVRSFFAPLTEDDEWSPQRDARGEVRYGVSVTGLNGLNISWYLNHSEEPNVAFQEAGEGEYNSYATRRRIQADEELTIDYRELGQEYHALVAAPARDSS